MVQTMRNQGIATVYPTRVEKINTSAKKKQNNGGEGSENTLVDATQEKMKVNEALSKSETVHTIVTYSC